MKNFNKFLLGLMLSALSFSGYAVSPGIPQGSYTPEPMIVSENDLIKTPLGIMPLNKINEKDIPSVLLPWVDWLKAKNNQDKCVIDNTNIKECIFAPMLQIDENENNFLFTIKGASYTNEFWLKLPSNLKLSFENVSLNNQKSILLENAGFSMILLKKGEFEIKFALDKKEIEKNPSLMLPQEFIIIKNNTNQNLIAQNGNLNFSSKQQVLSDIKSASQEIKVYRKFTDNIPLKLETRIKLTYSGQNKEIFLGKVIPDSFKLLNINSSLSVSERPEGFYVKASSGEHWVNFYSYSSHNSSNIKVAGLVKSVEQEFWSIEYNPNLRQIDVKDVNNLDPNQAFYPNEWRGLSAFLVKDSISFESSRRGVNIQDKLSYTVDRTSWYGFNNEKVLHLDRMNFINEGKNFIQFNETIIPKEFSVKQQSQMIVQDGKNQGIVIAQGSYPTSLYSQTGLDFNNQFVLDSRQEISNWNFNVAPRHRLLYASGVEKVYNSWIDNWNLYSVFAIFLISLGFYKLFGLPLALLSFSSIFLFQTQPFLAWTVWPLLLLLMALLKVLPSNNKFTKLVRIFSGTLVLSVAVIFITFTVKEFRYILNGSLETTQSASYEYVPEVAMMSDSAINTVPAPAAPMMNKSFSESVRVLSKEEFSSQINNIQTQKVQVTSGTPSWVGISYKVVASKDELVKFYVAPPWLVNVVSLIQIIDLLLVLIFLVLYVLNIYRKQELINKFPMSLRGNVLMRRILGEKHE